MIFMYESMGTVVSTNNLEQSGQGILHLRANGRWQSCISSNWAVLSDCISLRTLMHAPLSKLAIIHDW